MPTTGLIVFFVAARVALLAARGGVHCRNSDARRSATSATRLDEGPSSQREDGYRMEGNFIVAARRRLPSGFVAEEYVRPIFGVLDQSSPHWVRQDIIGFFAETFVASQPVIEEIGLPINW